MGEYERLVPKDRCCREYYLVSRLTSVCIGPSNHFLIYVSTCGASG
jgi:hypothetical protein